MVYRLPFDSAGVSSFKRRGLGFRQGSWLGVLISPAHPTTLANVEEIEDGKGVYVEGDERLPFKVRLELKEAMK